MSKNNYQWYLKVVAIEKGSEETVPVVNGRYAPSAHTAHIPWTARMNPRLAALKKLSVRPEDQPASEWSPQRVADAAARYQAGERSRYVEKGYRESVKRAEEAAKREREAKARQEAPEVIPSGYADKNLVLAHIALLRSSGMTDEEIKAEGNVNWDTWRRALNPDVSRMTLAVGERILAVPVPSRAA